MTQRELSGPFSRDADHARPSQPIVLVDDDPAILRAHKLTLETNGWEAVLCFSESVQAAAYFERNTASLLILDVRMPGLGGYDLARQVRGSCPDVPVIVISGVSDLQVAVQFMKLGCFDYLVKPVDAARFVTTVHRALEFRELRSALQAAGSEGPRPAGTGQPQMGAENHLGLATNSPRTARVYAYAASLASGREPILLRGETGTGKEVAAHAIHTTSGRPGPFVPVNVSGLDEALFADTLFGHTKGAYTHAEARREGLIGKARHGTLFLDEIGDLDAKNQVKLLRLIENREYYPLGSDVPVISEARLILATHQELESMVETGRFRKDLYYRIATFQVFLPPLRERPEDLLHLAETFLHESYLDGGLSPPEIDPACLSILGSYSYPGNIRELRSVLFRAAVGLKRDNAHRLTPQDLQFSEAMPTHPRAPLAAADAARPPDPARVFAHLNVLPSVDQAKDILIREAIDRAHGNISQAARLVGVTPQALHQWIRRRS